MNADKRGSEDCIECAVVRGVIRKSKRAMFSYIAGGSEKSAECATCETAADADALRAERRNVIHCQLHAFQTHQHVYRTID